MRKYRDAINKTVKEAEYNDLIRIKKKDGTFDKIKRSEQLRGQLQGLKPTDPVKIIELKLFESLAPILYLEPHRKLQDRVARI